MKRLIINGLFFLVFITVIIVVLMTFLNLRALGETEEQTAEIFTEQGAAVAEEKEIQEESTVKVTVSNNTTTSDRDVEDFLSSLS